MTPSLAQLAAAVTGAIAPAAPAGPAERPGVLVMPQQTAASGELAAANTSYSLPFSPGFLEGPVWPVESWLLSSFQVTLSGTVTVALGLEVKPDTETLPVVLALVQRGHPVWSQNLDLKLVPVLGSAKQRFNVQTSVFVDLTNPLRYDAGAQPEFVVSGLVPVWAPPGPTFESETLARLDTLIASLESQGATSEQIAAATESNGELLDAVVSELEAAGVTQTEAVELLEQIASNTETEAP